ncbi:MAG TPA: hypothetical protein VMV77_15160 [Bacteroidales bacterium]|nr:hypothetical protein [Bacteroidales bacterium]
MKTAHETIHKLYEASNLENIVIDWYSDGVVDKKYHDRWIKRLENIQINILLDWGRECCEEQRNNCSVIVPSAEGTTYKKVVHEIKKLIHNAPLPEILKDK